MPDVVSRFTSEIIDGIENVADRVRDEVASRKRPRVLLVPGLPGTNLGRRRLVVDDVVWFSLISLREGRIFELACDAPGPPVEPLGGVSAVYVSLKLRLEHAGYDVGVHPYDWRRPVRDLGEELSASIRAEGREVHVVAHSFGGIVARAAAALGTPNLGKVIMLGPPTHGSFSVVQGLRGSHWALHLMAAVDREHTAAELGEKVFGSWPSVYPLIPPNPTDLFDRSSWPLSGPGPRPELLAGAAEVQRWLDTAKGQFYVIAGHGFPTPERAELHDGIFHYPCTDAGDGLMLTSLARIEGYPCYYGPFAHVAMPDHPAVGGAVEDILAGGRTDRLTQEEPPAKACPTITDADPPEAILRRLHGPDVTDADLHAAFDEAAGFLALV